MKIGDLEQMLSGAARLRLGHDCLDAPCAANHAPSLSL